MRSQDLANNANIPYRRETFSSKRIVLDFDGGFNLADMNDVAGDARAKSLNQILHDLDSLKEFNDSVGMAYYNDSRRYTFRKISLPKNDSLKLIKELSTTAMTYDTLFQRQSKSAKQMAVKNAMSNVQAQLTDIEVRLDYTSWLHRNYRQHQIEAIGKFTLALSCLIFFFIGAPLGAIIRKGGLGMPVIISVLVFIVYYIFDNSGMRMARDGQWTILFGKLISTAVLAPIAVFFTYKANKDSTVFNIDLYKNFFMKLLGLRSKRHIFRKEVIIEDPKYPEDAEKLLALNQDIYRYTKEHKLLHWPSPIKVFFHEGDDQEMEKISDRLEALIDDLSYTKDKIILAELNHYPVLAATAHTRPFRKKWLNIIAGLIIPIGVFLYIRMIRFRMRLYRDLRTIRHTSDHIVERINNM
jgi:lipopolysaccharide export system permease protein